MKTSPKNQSAAFADEVEAIIEQRVQEQLAKHLDDVKRLLFGDETTPSPVVAEMLTPSAPEVKS